MHTRLTKFTNKQREMNSSQLATTRRLRRARCHHCRKRFWTRRILSAGILSRNPTWSKFMICTSHRHLALRANHSLEDSMAMATLWAARMFFHHQVRKTNIVKLITSLVSLYPDLAPALRRNIISEVPWRFKIWQLQTRTREMTIASSHQLKDIILTPRANDT